MNEKLTVLHFRSSPFLGGPEKLILLQAENLPPEVESAIVVLQDGPDQGFFREASQRTTTHLIKNKTSVRKTIQKVRELILETKPNILVSHDFKSNYVALKAAKGLSVCKVALFHGRTSESLKTKVYEWLDNRQLRQMDAVVTVSEETGSRLQKDAKLPKSPIVIRNAIAPLSEIHDSGAAKKYFGLSEETFCVGAAGRLSSEKQFDVLIQAFALLQDRFPHARLLIAGEGKEKKNLENLIAEKKLGEKIILTGFLDNLDLFYSAIDAFCLTSKREGLPMALLEAGARGVPLIAPNVGGIGEVIRHRENGLLLPSSKKEDVAAALSEIAAAPERKKWGTRAKEIIDEQFGPVPYGDQFFKLYRTLLKRDMMWLSWETHRRSREIAHQLGIPLFEVTEPGKGALQKLRNVRKTVHILREQRPKLVIYQCPSMVLGLLLSALKKFFGYRLVIDAHNEAVRPFIFSGKIAHWILKRLHGSADLSVVTNSFLFADAEQLGGRPFSLTDPIPDWPSMEPIPVKKPAALFVCSFAPDEPYQEVIEAARQLKGECFVYVTGNPLKGQAKAIQNAPDNLQFTGFIPAEDYKRLMRSVDVVIDLTEMEDCLVCGAYEAYAAEKPLITSDTRALRATFSKGALFSKGKADDLVSALRSALKNQRNLEKEVKRFQREFKTAWEISFNEFKERLNRLKKETR